MPLISRKKTHPTAGATQRHLGMCQMGDGQSMQTSLAQHYVGLLQETWRCALGPEAFGHDGRLVDWRGGLLPCLAELARHEVTHLFDPGRLRHPETASAMALNSFLPWRERAGELMLAGHGPFAELRFAARCPTGVRGTPPLLDLLATNGEKLVAVAARGPDYLGRKPSRLAAAYAGVTLPDGMAGWQALLTELGRDAGRFRHLDAAALLKNAIGLSRTFPGHRPTLLYVYWEPSRADELAFHRHRAEIRAVSQIVQGAFVGFEAKSFTELWSEWEALSSEPWLREMVAELRARYAVASGASTGL
jgi:hypothetical protein